MWTLDRVIETLKLLSPLQYLFMKKPKKRKPVIENLVRNVHLMKHLQEELKSSESNHKKVSSESWVELDKFDKKTSKKKNNHKKNLVSLAMHIQSRLESFQTVKTHYYIAHPKHLNFVSFLGYSLLLGGDQPQTTEP